MVYTVRPVYKATPKSGLSRQVFTPQLADEACQLGHPKIVLGHVRHA